MMRMLWKTEKGRAATLLCVCLMLLFFFFLLSGNFSVFAAESENRSHASSGVPCPNCKEMLTVVSRQEATCTVRAYVEYHCDECNQYHEMVYEGDLAPHSWKQIASTASTCTEAGSVTNKCTVCQTVKKTESGSALGHDYETQVVEPTCSSIGYTLHTCSRCGDTEQTDQVGMSDHTYQQVVISEPTCHSVGYLRNICTVCGTHTTEEMPVVQHSWKTDTVAATHTTQGYTVYSCQYPDCGKVIRQDFTATVPYTMVWEELTAPTCISGGVKVGHCSDGCGYTETVMLPYLGHSFGKWKTVYAATEKNDGLEQRVCERCKHTETQVQHYDPSQVPVSEESSESIDPLMLGVIGFLLLVGIGIVVLFFMLTMEHAQQEKIERKRRSMPQNE